MNSDTSSYEKKPEEWPLDFLIGTDIRKRVVFPPIEKRS